MRKIFFMMMFFFISCSGNYKSKNFFEKKIQNKDQRVIKGSLTAVDSVKISSFDIYNPFWLEMNKKYLFISNSKKLAIVKKGNFNKYYTIDFPEGRGPNEITGTNDLTIRDSLVGLIDLDQRKVLIGKLPELFRKKIVWTHDLVLDEKITPRHIEIIDPDTYLIFSQEFGSDYLFNIINKKGIEVSGFGKAPSKHNSLKYEGYITEMGRSIYYAGYGEPILKKYDMKGDVKYSISTIDNYDTEGNYFKQHGDGQNIYGFTPDAIFSTEAFVIYKNYWLILPDANGGRNFTFLDIYNEENGKYIASFDLNHITTQIQADDRFIYVIQGIDKEYYLKVYRNNIEQRLK